MMPLSHDQDYQSMVLKLYLKLPETPSRIHPNDRKMAKIFCDQKISLAIIESAFLLASLRRRIRSPDMPPLGPIRSLAYFFPVIQEVYANPFSDDYLEYLRRKVASLSGRG
jgi:hypothetical protein